MELEEGEGRTEEVGLGQQNSGKLEAGKRKVLEKKEEGDLGSVTHRCELRSQTKS